jgi:hypothetical protein
VLHKFRFLIHFELIYVHGLSFEPNFILLHMEVSCPSHICLKKTCSFSSKLSRNSANQFIIDMWVDFWTLNSISLVCMSVLNAKYCSLHYSSLLVTFSPILKFISEILNVLSYTLKGIPCAYVCVELRNCSCSLLCVSTH